MNYPVIILAGGKGTRLQHVVNDVPKPMAPVNEKPFLHYVIMALIRQGVRNIILSVGYKHASIINFFGNQYAGANIQYVIEHEPLGTGGGIKLALELVNDYAFVVNGDTFFDVPLNDFSNFYFKHNSGLAVALKPMRNFERYGTVELNEEKIIAFHEKRPCNEGLINGGIYFFHSSLANSFPNGTFSFETEVLEKMTAAGTLYGRAYNNYFIDIGIPEDYYKAQSDFATIFS